NAHISLMRPDCGSVQQTLPMLWARSAHCWSTDRSSISIVGRRGPADASTHRGASGVVGRQLIPQLISAGHEVTGLARSSGSVGGIDMMAVDALDPAAVSSAVERAEPDAIVHLLTAIPGRIDPKRIDEDFAMTNRLRTEGTANLLNAARRSGVGRIVAQGLGYAYDPHGPGLADESVPFWRSPPRTFAPVVAALREMEAAVEESRGTVLR